VLRPAPGRFVDRSLRFSLRITWQERTVVTTLAARSEYQGEVPAISIFTPLLEE